MIRRICALGFLVLAAPLIAQSVDPSPWTKQDAIIIPEPFSGNDFDFESAFKDVRLKAIVLKAGQGDRDDGKVLYSRAAEATRRGIPIGLYFWGVSTKEWTSTRKVRGTAIPTYHAGVPVRQQVRRFLTIASKIGPGLMALDLEGVNDGRHDTGIISLSDAERFVALLRKCTERDPALYSSQSTMKTVAAKFGPTSAFAHTPLWLAGPTIHFAPNPLWSDYVLWQFGAEWDCNPYRPKSEWDKIDYRKCDAHARYPVGGSHYDLDIDLYRGEADRLHELFGAPLHPDPACANS